MFKYLSLLILVTTAFAGCKPNSPSNEASTGTVTALLSLEELSKCRVYSSLDSALKQPDSVFCLSLEGQGLKAVPEEIFALRNLQYLSLANNQIAAIQPGVRNFENLQYLLVNDNQLTALPDEVTLLTNLVSMNADNNRIQQLPQDLSKLGQLVYFDAKHNNLSSLPNSLGRLANLKELTLSHNKIAILPESIGELAKLETLSLDSNSLSALPPGFEKLRKLSALSLINNRFEDGPAVLAKMQFEFFQFSPQPSIQASEVIFGQFVSEGTFHRLEQGDFLHFDLIEDDGDTLDLLCLKRIEGDFDKLQASLPGKGQRVQVRWQSVEKYFQEHIEGYAKVNELLKVELLK